MGRSRAIVLLSGGLDSSYNLWRAIRDYEVVLALTFDYGQRAAFSEVRAAAGLALQANVPHRAMGLPWFKEFTKTSLVDHAREVPRGQDVAIDSIDVSLKTAQAVWVPNRNGIFLNIASGYAEGLGADTVLTGFNLEEAATFPDNSLGFLEAINSSLKFSTANGVQVKSYCASMTKPEIVRDAKRIGLPLRDLWPCYLDGEEWCGQCESCLRFARAVREAGIGTPRDLTLD